MVKQNFLEKKLVKQSAWNNLQDCFDNNKVVKGTPFNRVKGRNEC